MIYIKNNRNEELTPYKKLFINSPQFVDNNGNNITVLIDGNSYQYGVDILDEGEHTLIYNLVEYKFVIYSNYSWWGAKYLKEILSNNLPEISESNIFLTPTINIDIKKFPAIWILCSGYSENNIELLSRSIQPYYRLYNYKLKIIYKVDNIESSIEKLYYLIDLITAKILENRQLNCFANDLNLNSFIITSVADDEFVKDNRNVLYLQAEAEINIEKGQINIKRG